MPHQLSDLDVERVDAVDQPATRRRFLIRKSEGADAAAAATTPAVEAAEALAAATALVKAATDAVTTIEKSADFGDFPEDVAVALDALAKAVGVNPFADGRKKKPVEEDKAAKAADPEATPATLTADAIAAAVGVEVAKSMAPVAAGLAAFLAKLDDVESIETTRGDAPASGQPAGQAVAKRGGERKFGEGMFANILHG